MLVPAALLLAAYLGAQGVAAAHELGTDAHPGGELCALCISLSTLGAADVPAAGPAAAVPVEAAVAATDPILGRARPCTTYEARAPPFAS